jgi:hypothetical protein
MPDTPKDPVRTRGRYVFTLDGEPAGIDERFVLGEIAPGVVRARTTRIVSRPVGRLESDARLEIRSLAVAVRWVGTTAGSVREASAELTEDADGVRASRVVEGTAYGMQHVTGRLNTLGHVVSGPLLLAARGGVDVVEPDLTPADDAIAFLAAVTTRWTTVDAGPVDVTVDGVERAGTAYLWTYERSGLDAHVVVDDGGLLMRSRLAAPDGLLEVTLADVTGPWPRPAAWLRA